MNNLSFMKMYKKRALLKKIVLGLFVLAIACTFCFAGITYNKNTKNPIVVKTSAELEKAIANKSYINFSAKEVYDLGIVEKETRSKYGVKLSENVTVHFFITNIEDKVLVFSVPSGDYDKFVQKQTGPYLLKGSVTKFSDKDLTSLKDFLIKDGVSAEDLNAVLYTSYLKLETPFDSVFGYILFPIIFIIIILTYIPTVLKSKKALKSLKNYFNGDLDMACEKIDNELCLSNVYENKPIYITENYIVTDTQQIVLGLPLKELMWAYKKTVKNKSIFSKSHSLVLVFSDKKKFEISLGRKEDKVNETLSYLEQHCPSVILGFSDELSKLFKKRPDEFIDSWKKSNINNI